jgi:4-aminobutyrate aminotransferase-like enzyme
MPPGPASLGLAERLRKVESRNVTHVSDRWPVFWEEASGSNVRDVDGNVFIDVTGAFGVALLGHGSEVTRSALAAQSGRLIHGMGDIHPPAKKLELLERLVAVAPWDDSRAVLSSTGSEATETALKTAQLATGKPGIVAFEGGYHGLTLGALSVTERAHFRSRFSSRAYAGVGFAPFPDEISDGAGAATRSLEVVRGYLENGAPNGDPVGCIIVEPVQARGGARIPPRGFMRELGALANAAGVLVIADEIMTGLGRCGSPFASGLVGLVPDVVCVGKSLGGGLPISACIASAAIMDAWPESDGEAIHTSTFLGHPLACAVAVDVLEVVCSESFSKRVTDDGARWLSALTLRLAHIPEVASVRGMGLLLGIEFGGPAGWADGAGVRVAEQALAQGLIALPAGDHGHVLELTPPVGMTDEQVRWVVECLGVVIEAGL